MRLRALLPGSYHDNKLECCNKKKEIKMIDVTNEIIKLLFPSIGIILKYIINKVSVVGAGGKYKKLTAVQMEDFLRFMKRRDRLINYNSGYEVQYRLENYGIKYSFEFMKKLFMYLEDKKIMPDNYDLVCFIRSCGVFRCLDDGRTEIRRHWKTANLILITFTMIVLICACGILIPCIYDVFHYFNRGDFKLLVVAGLMCVFYLFCIYVLLVILKDCIITSFSALVFRKKYHDFWLRNISE